MIGLKQVTTKLRARKKVFIAMFASLLVLILVGLGVFLSARAWRDYETSYNTSFESAKTAVGEVLLSTSKPVLSSADKLDQLVQIQTVLKEGVKSYCNVNPIIKWQGFIKQYAHKVSDCKTKKDNFTEFLSKLTDVTAYLKAEQDLATIIKQANDKTSQNNQPDKWKDIESFWRQATVDTNKLPDTSQFKPVKLLAVNKFDQLAESWKQLSSANDAKNSQQFDDAHASVIKSVASLQEIGETSQSATKQLGESSSKSYDSIH